MKIKSLKKIKIGIKKLARNRPLWDNYSRRNEPDGLLARAARKLAEEKKLKF